MQDDFPVKVSEAAAQKLISALEAENQEKNKNYTHVRISVIGGGCSGFQYGLDFAESIEEDDILSEQHGALILCDNMSANYLEGTRLEYLDTLQNSGFKFENPNAKRTCGCGSSFDV